MLQTDLKVGGETLKRKVIDQKYFAFLKNDSRSLNICNIEFFTPFLFIFVFRSVVKFCKLNETEIVKLSFPRAKMKEHIF
jgi:hypothetical protein